MFNLSSIAISLDPSRIYGRLIWVLYGLTLGLIYLSGTYLLIKIILFLLATWFCYLSKYALQKSAIHYHRQEWHLIHKQMNQETYQQANLLFHNDLFLLIQFVRAEKKKLFVLFRDQISQEELRMLCRQLLLKVEE